MPTAAPRIRIQPPPPPPTGSSRPLQRLSIHLNRQARHVPNFLDSPGRLPEPTQGLWVIHSLLLHGSNSHFRLRLHLRLRRRGVGLTPITAIRGLPSNNLQQYLKLRHRFRGIHGILTTHLEIPNSQVCRRGITPTLHQLREPRNTQLVNSVSMWIRVTMRPITNYYYRDRVLCRVVARHCRIYHHREEVHSPRMMLGRRT